MELFLFKMASPSLWFNKKNGRLFHGFVSVNIWRSSKFSLQFCFSFKIVYKRTPLVLHGLVNDKYRSKMPHIHPNRYEFGMNISQNLWFRRFRRKGTKYQIQSWSRKNFSVGNFSTFYLYFAKIYCEINKITFWKHPSSFTAN